MIMNLVTITMGQEMISNKQTLVLGGIKEQDRIVTGSYLNSFYHRSIVLAIVFEQA